MEPRFKSLPLEKLQQAVDDLIYTLLNSIDSDEETIDSDDMCEALETFAGREYIVHTKINNELPLSKYDREYLSNLITSNNVQR